MLRVDERSVVKIRKMNDSESVQLWRQSLQQNLLPLNRQHERLCQRMFGRLREYRLERTQRTRLRFDCVPQRAIVFPAN